jgi:hypothetical protein
MAMIAKQVCSREVRLRNTHSADENAAGARDKGNTSEMVPRRILKASRPVVTDNYGELHSISLGGDTNMVTGKGKAHG